MNLSKVVGYLGRILLLLGLFMGTALPWAWVDEGLSGTLPWLQGMGICILSALLLIIFGRRSGDQKQPGSREQQRHDQELSRREALAIVSASWVACGLFGAVPFLLAGMVSSPVDAIFETVSGVTTTGSTILTDIEAQSRACLWWRSLLQWLGGMGIVVFFLVLFPQVGGGGRKLFHGEVPGPEKEQLRPRIAQTSAMLWRIYTGLTLVALGLYLLEGMSLHDAACHAFSTLATGGFSTQNASIAGFDSVLIEMTVMALMLIAGCNFGLYFLFSRTRKLRSFFDAELMVYLCLALVATVLLFAAIQPLSDEGLLHSLRLASFQAVALLTGTGFCTTDYGTWPAFAHVILVILMFVGGMAGSTAGGFKVSRMMILLNSLVHEVRRSIHPRGIFTTRLGGRPVEERVVHTALTMFAIALVTLVLGSAAIASFGVPLVEAFSSTLTAMCNVGPALGSVGPANHFADLPDQAKLIMATLMIVGRLEFFTALAVLTPNFWSGR